MSSLFDRLGGSEGIRTLVDTVVAKHLENPLIARRFEPVVGDPERKAAATQHLCAFLEEGAGGPTRYTGKSMPDAHAGMNISGEEYLAAMDDIMLSLQQHGVDEATQKDVLHIAYSLKPQIVRL